MANPEMGSYFLRLNVSNGLSATPFGLVVFLAGLQANLDHICRYLLDGGGCEVPSQLPVPPSTTFFFPCMTLSLVETIIR